MFSKNLSIYIPHVFSNITKERIGDVFSKQSLGDIQRVDFIPKKGKDGKEYNMAFIHLNWYDNDCVRNLQEKIHSKTDARIVYDDPWFWNLYENMNPRSANELKMEEQIINLTKIVKDQNTQIEKMDAFTQYLEDELNQSNARIHALRDTMTTMMMTTFNQSNISSPMPLQRLSPQSVIPHEISADISNELANFGNSDNGAPLRMSDLEDH